MDKLSSELHIHVQPPINAISGGRLAKLLLLRESVRTDIIGGQLARCHKGSASFPCHALARQ